MLTPTCHLQPLRPEFRAVAADNGAIGGTGSHEFHVIASTGEDALVYCPTSTTPPIWKRPKRCRWWPASAAAEALTKTATPNATKCETVAEQLLLLSRTVKTIALTVETKGRQTD
jgi:prolyl-tRNA synthetase